MLGGDLALLQAPIHLWSRAYAAYTICFETTAVDEAARAENRALAELDYGQISTFLTGPARSHRR
jgi:hypothetical protein